MVLPHRCSSIRLKKKCFFWKKCYKKSCSNWGPKKNRFWALAWEKKTKKKKKRKKKLNPSTPKGRLAFFSSRPSRRQNPQKKCREVLVVKRTIFFCENLILRPRSTGWVVKTGPFEGDFALMFFIFHFFHFSLEKCFFFFIFLVFLSKRLIAGIEYLHGDLVSWRHRAG